MDYDFSFFLVVATFVTGVISAAYWLYLKYAQLPSPPVREPMLVEYARSFFPVVLIVLILRSFLFEPFRIPSGSMMPTLLIGDFILVNKFSYGVRLPVLNTKFIGMGEPERGDIVVFRFPKQPSVDYIKRVIGLPGDRIAYFDKKLYINGQPAKQVSLGSYKGVGQGANMTGSELLTEDLDGVEHDILIHQGAATVEDVFVVPKGQYFVMGDNRDNSNDSRYWGTVPEGNLVGKAFFIWMNWDLENGGIAFSRLGTVLK
ncbi:MAG: signal peptidase I [Methylococcales bacterium]|nr:signal peptidase I [Methylococcales bacterium]